MEILNGKEESNQFLYDAELIKKRKDINNPDKEQIDQKEIPYYDKLDIFIKALKKNKEEDKVDSLYYETIELLSKKKSFSFLIHLFIRVYNQKYLCQKLLEIFREMSHRNKTKDKNKLKNKALEAYNDIMNKIASKADILMRENNYNPIDFYGVILCYFNCFDDEKFLYYSKNLYEYDSPIIFDILLKYVFLFCNPINQELNFFKDFINYSIKQEKNYTTFTNGLKLLENTEIFLEVIEYLKYEIVEKYSVLEEFRPITIKNNLIKNDEETMMRIFDLISSIIEFSKINEVILVYFDPYFWSNMLNTYNQPALENIEFIFKLREILIEYNNFYNSSNLSVKYRNKSYYNNYKNSINNY